MSIIASPGVTVYGFVQKHCTDPSIYLSLALSFLMILSYCLELFLQWGIRLVCIQT